jgi:hypothetical protein
MDPQLKSALTTIGMIISTSIASWAATKGFITTGDQANVANALVAVGGGVVTAGLAYWKTRDHSQAAIIKQVNASDNGVKVVPNGAVAPQVNGPLK